MKIPRLLLFLLISSWLFALPSAAQEAVGWEIRARSPQGELEYDPATGALTEANGIIVTYQDIVLTADKVTANENTGDVLAEGNVTIKSSDNLWTGDRFIYNFKTRQISAGEFKSGRPPFFITGESLAINQTNKTYTATNALVTTDDYEVPAYKIRARSLTLVPGEYIEAKNATLYLGNVPVFYYPYYRRSLQRHPNNFAFEPGYRGIHGAYLLSTYNWFLREELRGSVHFDMRSRRGLAAGPDLSYDAGKFGKGDVEYYFAADDDPGSDNAGNPISRHRQRLRFTHRADFDTNFTFKTAVRYQSDPFIVRDFFEYEYRRNVQPNTFADVTRFWDNWALDVLVQPQVNDFFETVERLPDVRLTGLRQQIGATPLFYDSESTVGYYQRRFASTNLFQPDFSAFRGDTYHQITLPQTYFGWLNVTPRAGGRLTYYSEAHGPGATTGEEIRGVFNTGAEVSFKASRVWNNAESKFWDVNGLRHIVQPSVNYVFVPEPNARPPELPQFDPLLPSFRLLPIEFPDFNAIDAIDSENVLRFSLRNKLQTKRDDVVENFANWALYTDWRLDPRTNQTTFADLYSDFDLRPRSWLWFSSEMRFDIQKANVREANHRVTLAPNNRWSLALGHRYLDNDPAFGIGPTGHNLIYDSFYYRINENWAWRMAHYFEARDGTMEEQYYTIYRDLRSWTSALTFRLRDNRNGPFDFTVAITFSLKAFPRYKTGEDTDRPWMLIGG